MDAIFYRHPGPGSAPVDPWPARVIKSHPDGTATIEVTVPGGLPAVLVARQGDGEPGTWAPLAPLVLDTTPIPPPDPAPVKTASRKRAARATVPESDPLAGPDRCGMCLRMGRWTGRYCSPSCETRAATPANVDPWSKKRIPYTA